MRLFVPHNLAYAFLTSSGHYFRLDLSINLVQYSSRLLILDNHQKDRLEN